MLDNIESIVIILSAIISTGVVVTTIFYSIQRSFRHYIDNSFLTRDLEAKKWILKSIEEHYYFLNERLHNLEIRIKQLENK